MKIIKIKIPEYVFNKEDNPYFFNASNPRPVSLIAGQIEKSISDNFDTNDILVRGVQFGRHNQLSKKEFIDSIIEIGSDINGDGTIHAAPFSDDIVEKILEGFHVYKPKGEERPQYSVDIWMVFDKKVFKNVEYIHPRHHVVVRDKWELNRGTYGLLGLIIIN